jgi:nucleoside-diphosphate-sugar epimerase
MNILLTGANGFLGSGVAKALLARGDRVLAYKRETSDLRRLGEQAGEILWFDYGIAHLHEPFERGERVDAIIHTATCYGRRGESTSEVLDINMRVPLFLYEISRRAAVPAFLNAHTSLPLSLDAYALSKHQLLEWLLLEAGASRVVHMRLESIFGPGDDPAKFNEWIMRQFVAGAESVALTPGQQNRDFVYIDDAVAACLACLDHAAQFMPNEVVDVGSGTAVSIRHFAECGKRITAAGTRLDFGALPYRPNELMHSQADLSRLSALGWRPKVSLEDGLKNVTAYLRSPPP